MKTLADFKRRLTPGTKLMIQWHKPMLGGIKSPEERTVVQAKSTEVVFLTPAGKKSYLSWPKAADCHCEENQVSISDEVDGKPLLTYTFL